MRLYAMVEEGAVVAQAEELRLVPRPNSWQGEFERRPGADRAFGRKIASVQFEDPAGDHPPKARPPPVLPRVGVSSRHGIEQAGKTFVGYPASGVRDPDGHTCPLTVRLEGGLPPF